MTYTVDKPSTIPTRLDYSWNHTPLPGSTKSPSSGVETGRQVGQINDTLYKLVRQVDPLRRVQHGYYDRSHVAHKNLAHIDAFLQYDSGSNISVQNRMRYTWSVKGTAAGWVSPPNHRLLLTQEQHKAQLINQVVAGITARRMDLAQFIAQADQTGNFVANAARRIAASIPQIRRGQLAAAARTLGLTRNQYKTWRDSRGKHAANLYLATNFGWMPILYDMVDALKHLHDRGRALRIQSRARLTTLENGLQTSSTLTSLYGSNENKLQLTWNNTWRRERHEQVFAEYRLKSSFFDEAGQLGLTNPQTVLWNVIPLSWMADQFANIGDWLGNLDFALGLEFVTASYTQDCRTTETIVGTPRWTSVYTGGRNYVDKPGSPVTVPCERYILKREVLQEALIAVSLLLRSPLGIQNAANDLAVVTQMFSNQTNKFGDRR